MHWNLAINSHIVSITIIIWNVKNGNHQIGMAKNKNCKKVVHASDTIPQQLTVGLKTITGLKISD